jgi:hypothetical protein
VEEVGHDLYPVPQRPAAVWAYKDNIRFLPKVIGNLLLVYIACSSDSKSQVPLSRHICGQSWTVLYGLTAVFQLVCAKHVLEQRFHSSRSVWWRQVAALNDLEDYVGDNIEDELDLVALAEQSNHSYYTFNHAYVGTTTLTMSALLHRNYRASESWRTFFRFDHLLQGKRPRGALETQYSMLPSVISFVA